MQAGVASLRFDLRGHGDGEGRQEDLTLAAILNDIRAALEWLRQSSGASRLSLLGASFTGGACAYYAARRAAEIDRLVLLNPQLNYKKRTIDSRAYWHDDQLGEVEARGSANGYIQFTPTCGTAGPSSTRSSGSSRSRSRRDHRSDPADARHQGHLRASAGIPGGPPSSRAEHRLMEIEGSQHGFAVHDDPAVSEPAEPGGGRRS